MKPARPKRATVTTVASQAREWRQQLGSAKLGSKLAAEIEHEISAASWPVGEVLGSEADLMASHGVSRAVFREAVRLLEHHGSASMRRGPGGGLVVREPVASAVTASAAVYLDYLQVTPQQLHEIRSAIEVAGVEMATSCLDEEGIGLLRLALEVERDGLDSPDDEHEYLHDRLHILIAELTGNPVFPLFMTVLSRLTYERSTLKTLPQQNDKQVFGAHEGIVEAIVSGDVALARHRMARHLEALNHWFASWAP